MIPSGDDKIEAPTRPSGLLNTTLRYIGRAIPTPVETFTDEDWDAVLDQQHGIPQPTSEQKREIPSIPR